MIEIPHEIAFFFPPAVLVIGLLLLRRKTDDDNWKFLAKTIVLAGVFGTVIEIVLIIIALGSQYVAIV